MNILRIDCADRTYKYESLAEDLKVIGGRGFIGRILRDEIPAGCYPLGPENKLIICNGPLAGLGISSAGRLSIGGKSPLTGGVKESNSGGTAADALAKLGLRAVILENQPKEESWSIIKLDEDKVEFIDAAPYLGLGNYNLRERLVKDFSDSYSTITLGQSGEMKYLNSSIAMSDKYGRPCRMAARGGMGALMGSKGIKGFLIKENGSFKPDGAERAAFKESRRVFHKIVTDSERIKVLREYGTASTVMDAQRLGALPTCNFTIGQFEDADKISGEYLHDLINKRGGDGTNSESCMGTCIIQCSNHFADHDGKAVVGPLEYETLSLLGSNLGIGDLDVIAELNYMCNDLGLDTIETGGALGVMAEAGLLKFGDADGFRKAVREVPSGGWLGRLVGMGTGITAKVLNVRRAPVVKNQCMSGYDPRGVKGTGVTYATSPMGADHTAGLTVYMPVDHHNKKDQIETSRKMQVGRCSYDVLGLCTFLLAATAMDGDKVVDMLNSLYDLQLPPDYLLKLGKNTILIEKEYNCAAGFDKRDDRIPSYFIEETLPPFNLRWDIDDAEMDAMFGESG
jgi:aldehyde:ferredoxin oxidoreductase